MQTLSNLREAVKFDLGELSELIRDSRIDQWLNEGQDRLDIYIQRTAELSWLDGATSIEYPTDFVRPERTILAEGISELAPGGDWGTAYVFDYPARVTAGSGTLRYWAHYPAITGGSDSVLPPIGDQAVVSWAIYRAFKWLTTGRADYRRFSTITQSNGVDVSELDAIAERHKADFDEARATLHERLESTSFFG